MTRVFRTVKAGAEVHRVAVAAVSCHSAGPDLHHVGGGGPQPLHLGRAVLGGDGVGHGFALEGHRGQLEPPWGITPNLPPSGSSKLNYWQMTTDRL